MQQAKTASITGVWGGRGSGKTTKVKELIRDRSRVIVFDPLEEYAAAGFRAVRTLPELWSYVKESWQDFRLAYLPHDQYVAELVVLSSDVFTAQAPYKDGRDGSELTLVVEEMSLSVPNVKHALGEGAFLRLCNIGRHYGVSIIGTSQRLAHVHTDFRGNTSDDYFFRLRDHADHQAAIRRMGPEQADTLRGLQTHDYLHVQDGNVTRGRNAPPS